MFCTCLHTKLNIAEIFLNKLSFQSPSVDLQPTYIQSLKSTSKHQDARLQTCILYLYITHYTSYGCIVILKSIIRLLSSCQSTIYTQADGKVQWIQQQVTLAQNRISQVGRDPQVSSSVFQRLLGLQQPFTVTKLQDIFITLIIHEQLKQQNNHPF